MPGMPALPLPDVATPTRRLAPPYPPEDVPLPPGAPERYPDVQDPSRGFPPPTAMLPIPEPPSPIHPPGSPRDLPARPRLPAMTSHTTNDRKSRLIPVTENGF
eukprot:scaffold1411_cov125-Isochrysis_galbana.AAC.14